MDTANVTVLRRPESPPGTVSSGDLKTLRVTATYMLSENGRKASLLAGGNGRAEQTIDLDVPGTRLHLVTVDADGNAKLKLRPRYSTSDSRISRIDALPIYDAPPSVDDLLLTAAKNHELERAYIAQGSRREHHRQDQRELRSHLAEQFLRSPEMRAAVHPTPSRKRCYLQTDTARILFDADRDDPPARDVPEEAHRRFRADERARREHNLREHARRLAVHEEKQQFIAGWIAAKGSQDQRERQAAGLLPVAEAVEAIADEAFASLCGCPRYERNGAPVLQAHLRRHAQYKEAIVTERDLAVIDSNAGEATATQWQAIQRAKALMPTATITLRAHRLTWRADAKAPTVTLYGLLVVVNNGPITVRREFNVPD